MYWWRNKYQSNQTKNHCHANEIIVLWIFSSMALISLFYKGNILIKRFSKLVTIAETSIRTSWWNVMWISVLLSNKQKKHYLVYTNWRPQSMRLSHIFHLCSSYLIEFRTAVILYKSSCKLLDLIIIVKLPRSKTEQERSFIIKGEI